MIRRALLLTLIGLLILGGLTWVNYRFSIQNPGGNDFLARWMGARMWVQEGISPYTPTVSLATQMMIYGHPADPGRGEDLNHFVYPMYAMLFFAPFGMFDYLWARVFWMTLLELSQIGLVGFGFKLVNWKPGLLMFGVCALFSLTWYHGARTIIIGQFAAINAFLIILSFVLIKKKRDVLAGVVLILTLSKPQMVYLLLPFIAIWAVSKKRYRLLGSMVLTFILLTVITLTLIPTWPIQMLAQVREYPQYTAIGSPINILAEMLPVGAPYLEWGMTLLLAGTMFLVWVRTWGGDCRRFVWTGLLTLTVTNLIALRTATTNYVVLLPVLFLLFRNWEQHWARTGRMLSLLVLGSLFAGLWLLFFQTVTGNFESPWMYLPLPILCLISLIVLMKRYGSNAFLTAIQSKG